MKFKEFIICSAIASFSLSLTANASQRWDIKSDGSIKWEVTDASLPHSDHIEMSGEKVSAVLRYGIDKDNVFHINKSLVWPGLRTIPNNTHASLMRRFDWNPLDAVTVNGRSLTGEKVQEISLKGMLNVKSQFNNGYFGNYELIRTYLPAADKPALIEKYDIVNNGDKPLKIEIPDTKFTILTDRAAGVAGSYRIVGSVDTPATVSVAPGDTLTFHASILATEDGSECVIEDFNDEIRKREDLIGEWTSSLVLQTPDPVIDRMFSFSKIRACESIYDTKGGPMHGPGGESYYAAIWANDQAEYINPFFPFVGYDLGNKSAVNSFKHFARFMNDDMKPIPSSIIAEGLDIWNGVGDRGDAAMIAYGAARYALASGNREEALKLWDLIEWCLNYCEAKLNEDGVVQSDTDELENRFESGDANLCTSSLYYDALNSAACLARDLGINNGKAYLQKAQKLKDNIEKYFGANVSGFDTYAYYKGNDKLRAWICIPLVAGIKDRAKATLDALFSDRLWTENGLLTEEGDKTFWDRSTLYALRGAYAVGETERATNFLHNYSQTRLLGEHVPYAIEAWPEGNQRHLSAESGLYGRIVTEGIFGIRPTGLKSFSLTPALPANWDHMSLSNIKAFGSDFDIKVERAGNKLKVNVINGKNKKQYTVTPGTTINVKL